MSENRLVITGTDTGVGKTVVAAMLVAALRAAYWKPIQAGLEEGETDSQRVARLAGVGPERMLPEDTLLAHPLSPHRAAELEGLSLDVERLAAGPPETGRLVVVEGAGGVLVPLTRQVLQADLFARWGYPVVVCARTTLGTLNHTLLTLEALRVRGVEVRGVVFVGEENPDNQRTIQELGRVKELGRLPWLPRLDAASLGQAFQQNFRREDFLSGVLPIGRQQGF
ncbi:MAG: dethiobiotin synthase [Deltaproteobacteria bacterium]|nr:dethiobiotin synthase [Deltaproteobacteria bacterium]